ncbi:MAG TPA: PPC domain-containing protein [Verrucomicrobiae bacterium]|nr:PPC domain-containing protein [Verrucomicrobiae bacterium]
MGVIRRQMAMGFLVCAAATQAAFGQRPQLGPRDPHIGYIYPAGGQSGSSVQVLISGQFLEGADDIHVSGDGIKASIVKYHKFFQQGDIPRIRNAIERAQQVLEKKLGRKPDAELRRGGRLVGKDAALVMKEAGVTEDDFEHIEEFLRLQSNKKRQLNPQLLEDVTVRLEILPDAVPGDRSVRVMTPFGLSNPLCFQVGAWAECRETEPNDKEPDRAIGAARPVVVNGQILPGDVDRFSFRATKGTKLVIAARARGLIPYLADAVPGWFQAALTLYDGRGTEVAFDDDFGCSVDPVVHCEIPGDGEYILEIKDALYRGREDFVYRIAIGEVPFVTSIFPSGGRAGEIGPVAASGWNLAEAKFTPKVRGGTGIREVEMPGTGAGWNQLPFAVDTLPESVEAEPNSSIETAQRVTPPVIVNGRIGAPGDWDVFRIDGRAGSELIAEVFARRLNSPLDSVLKLLATNGREMASNDDNQDKACGLETHHADSRLSIRFPASGTYYLRLGDTQRHGGDDYGYRLRIASPQPDFDLRVVPSSVNGRAGASIPITVYALRRDGFAGDIDLSLKDTPPGFRLSGGKIPGNEEKLRLTLTMPDSATAGPVRLAMEGRATIRGREVVRAAVPAEDMMQAFAYRHLVPAEDWYAVVTTGGGRFTPPALKVAVGNLVRVRTGAVTRIPLPGLGGPMMDQVRLELSEPPEGLAIERVSREGGGVQLLLKADPKTAKPGLKGNLIVEGYFERSFSRPGATGNTVRIPIGTLPAIPFEIVSM